VDGEKLRKAFYAAVSGCQKLVGSEAFPDRSVEAAAVEVTRTLGDNADRRPTFTLLVEALRVGNPAPVLDLIGRICGVRWEKVANPPAEELAKARAQLAAVQAELTSASERFEAAVERMERRSA